MNNESITFLNIISSSIINYICEKVATTFQLNKEDVKRSILDETFIYKKEENNSETLNSSTIPLPTFNCEDYKYNFNNLEYQSSQEFWKHVGIRIEGKKYRLQLSTNLVLDPREDGKLYLVGMRNNEDEFIPLDELNPIIFKWCDIHSIKY
jgi:hypothetical protein